MTKEKRVLGKGLSALISQIQFPESKDVNENKKVTNVYDIKIEYIVANPNQPRKLFEQAELADLSSSIKEHGVLQPILIKQCDVNSYELIAGERRLQASKLAGLKTIPAIIKHLTEIESFEYAIIENIQRHNLDPLEEGMAYKKLMDMHDYTQEKIALKMGKSRSHIANCIRLLSLPQDILNMVKEGEISFGHAKILMSAENPQKLAKNIVKNNLSVRQSEELIKKNKVSKTKEATKSISKDNDIRSIEQMLTGVFNLPISIEVNKSGGQVQINFKSLEDLDQIIQLIGSQGVTI